LCGEDWTIARCVFMKFRRWKEGGKGWNESIEAVFFEMKVCLASLIVDSLWITDYLVNNIHPSQEDILNGLDGYDGLRSEE